MDRENDRQIAEQVRSALADDLRLSASDLHVACRDRVVYLSGVVDVLAEKTQAEELARRIPGVQEVENNLTVSTDHAPRDGEIKRAIEHIFLHDPAVATFKVGADVHQGVATLVGNVDTLAEERAAINAAEKAYGVKKVISQIKVGGEKIDDVTLVNRVEYPLTNKLNHPDIAPSVRNGVATLTGWVQRPEDVELAGELVMGVPGIKEVKNLVKSRNHHRKI